MQPNTNLQFALRLRLRLRDLAGTQLETQKAKKLIRFIARYLPFADVLIGL